MGPETDASDVNHPHVQHPSRAAMIGSKYGLPTSRRSQRDFSWLIFYRTVQNPLEGVILWPFRRPASARSLLLVANILLCPIMSLALAVEIPFVSAPKDLSDEGLGTYVREDCSHDLDLSHGVQPSSNEFES